MAHSGLSAQAWDRPVFACAVTKVSETQKFGRQGLPVRVLVHLPRLATENRQIIGEKKEKKQCFSAGTTTSWGKRTGAEH